jgi:hypothetical protein
MKKLVLLLVSLAACGGGLHSESKQDIENAAKTSAAAYRYMDADTPAAALIRASHCADQAVIRNEGLDPVDSGVPCQ